MKQVRQNKADPRGESSYLSLSGVALKTPANVVEILINIVAEADGPSSRKPGGNQRPLHRSGLDTFLSPLSSRLKSTRKMVFKYSTLKSTQQYRQQ